MELNSKTLSLNNSLNSLMNLSLYFLVLKKFYQTTISEICINILNTI